MKSFKSVITKAAFLLAFTSATASFTPLEAQISNQTISANEWGDIQYVSMEGDMLVFDLRLTTLLPKGSTLRILDEENNVMYEEETNTETYNIRFKIVRNDARKINFEVSNRKLYINQSFNVNFKMEEKIEISKV